MNNVKTFGPGELLRAPDEIMDFADGKALDWAKFSGAVSNLCIAGNLLFAGTANGELAAFARK